MMYKILLGMAALAALAIGAFFVIGLTDGSVAAFNARIWIVIWCYVAGVIAIGIFLHRNGNNVLANLALALLAVPALFFVVFVTWFALSGEKWI